mgnify:CR=1 FL=1
MKNENIRKNNMSRHCLPDSYICQFLFKNKNFMRLFSYPQIWCTNVGPRDFLGTCYKKIHKNQVFIKNCHGDFIAFFGLLSKIL